MKIIERTEPTTGGEQRTPRERIEPVFATGDLVEPDQAADASSSEGWENSAGPGVTTWQVQLAAMREFVIAAAMLDSQAKEEQSGGSDAKGGIYTAFFNQGLVVVGDGDDDGDLNESNFDRKINAIRVRTQEGELVPLPYGGTNVMPTINYLDKHYLGEFEKDEDTGLLIPVEERPKRARVLWTDGAMKDYEAFGRRLEESHGDRWPQEEWFVAILGSASREHDETLHTYQMIAKRHSNVHVYSFEGVANGAEIAEDMAIATLGHKLAA